MSDFSERCKQLLLESGSNVYQIAKRSGLDRTSIQRMITGNRMPSPKFVREFCSNLRINPVEEEELLKLYIIEKVGKPIYQNRLYVKNLIEGISETIHHPKSYYFNDIITHPQASSGVFQNEKEIYNILLNELQDTGSSEICLYVPASYQFLFNMLQSLFQNAAKPVKITHLLALNKNPSGSSHCTYNMEILYQLLPIYKNLGSRYTAYYLYNKLTPDDEEFMIMPYFILTASYVVLIASDLTTHIILNSPDTIEIYRHEFERVLAFSKCLVSRSYSADELEARLNETTQIYGSPSYALKYYPDFLFSKKYSNVYFSREGFENFYINGELISLDSSNVPKSKRKMMLQNFLQKNKIEKFNAYMLKDKFAVPPYLNIELFNNHYLHLYFIFPNKQVVCFSLDESSICEAFYDFFDSLPDTDLIYNKEESNLIINKYLQ